MAGPYVEQCDSGYWISGTRVSLDSIVYAFLAGQTAESIGQSFPSVPLERVYGAIAFYLANRDEVDSYLTKARDGFEAKRLAARQADPAWYQKLADARRQSEAARP